MRLLTKTALYYSVLSALLFIIGGVVLFFVLRSAIYGEVDERLHSKKHSVEREIKDTGKFPSPSLALEISESGEGMTRQTVLRDTMLRDVFEDDMVPFRLLVFTTTIGTESRRIVLKHSLLESDELVEWILWVLLIFLAVLIAGLAALNVWISKKVWAPFYRNMEKIKNFKLTGTPRLDLTDADIMEFKWLKQAVEDMAARIISDYKNIKEFTENASHEIQTPLAVITSKIELLIQSGDLDQKQVEIINQAYRASQRLSRLNRALALLTRIENREYGEKEDVNLADLIQKHLDDTTELIESRQISVKKELARVALRINSSLADILVSNLVSNAIRHNVEKGEINIRLSPESLIISNTGKEPPCPADQLFERFKKGDPSSGSLGLGLSIAAKIADINGLSLEYEFVDGLHTLKFFF
jgi:signal transduction histidine kinase